MEALTKAGIFLVGLVFDIYIILLIVRFLCQKLGAHYYNPVVQFIIKVTNFFVKPIQRVIPGYKGFDFGILFLILFFEVVQTLLLFWLRIRVVPGFGGTIVISIAMVCDKFINLYFYVIILRVVMSWVTSLQRSAAAEIIYLISEPLMRQARRIIPTIAGFDFSPIVILVVLQLISILAFNPILELGMKLALT